MAAQIYHLPRAVTSALSISERESIVQLAQRLIRVRSEPFSDKRPVVQELAEWFDRNQLKSETLTKRTRDGKSHTVGLLSEVGVSGRGPTICLTACLDTAPIYNIGDWEHDPLSGHVSPDGRLWGRGSADSKTSVAIFAHIMRRLARDAGDLGAHVTFLADSDEHNGKFGAIKEYVRRYPSTEFVFIGYPGQKSVRIGSRGFLRVRFYVFGETEHTGSRNKGLDVKNAIAKAIALGEELQNIRFPREKDGYFEFGPKLTITEISGGGNFTNVPNKCRVSVDVRLTPGFQKNDAMKRLLEIKRKVDESFPCKKETEHRVVGTWPAYRLPEDNKYVDLLRGAATNELEHEVPLEVTGPSNVGNFLFQKGIPATSGFGVNYNNLHSANENIEISSIDSTFMIYMTTIASVCPAGSGMHGKERERL